MKKIFITGGAGFIGSHLARKLARDGHQVTVFDLNYANLCKLQGGNIRMIQGDIRDKITLLNVMKGHDLVWHLAANTDIPNGHKDTRLDLEHCTIGTCNVLDAMVAHQIPDLLFASTAAVYGTGAAEQPAVETMAPLRPISLYAAGKLACEAFISGYCHLYGIRANMFRFGNVVGGGMDHGVIFDLIQKLRKNPKRLEVWGDGRGRKPFFLVEDCIRGMEIAYQHSVEMDSYLVPCEVYNLGTSTNSQIGWVAEQVVRIMGLDAEIVYTGNKQGFPGDVPVVRYDAGRMNALGWQPSGTSDEAVLIAIDRLLR